MDDQICLTFIIADQWLPSKKRDWRGLRRQDLLGLNTPMFSPA